MKVSRKLVAIFTLIMMLVLSACSSGSATTSGKGKEAEGKSSGKKVIGVSLSNFSDEFRTYMIDAMKKEQEKYPEYEFMYSIFTNTSQTFLTFFSTRSVDSVVAVVYTETQR